MWFAAVTQCDECCRPGLYITLYAIQAHVTWIEVMDLSSYETHSARRRVYPFLSMKQPATLPKIQKTHLVFANIAEFSHRNCVLVSHWLSTVVMTLRCCQHKSTPHGHCREDDTVERRSHDLWPCSVDSVWLLSTAELSCVDTKWLSYSDRQWEKQERGSVLSGQHRNSATQSDNRENTFTWDKLPRPWPPTISFPLLRYFLWTKKKKTVQKWQVWICRPLCWNEVGRNSSSGREEKVPLSGQIRFEGWRAAFCEFELQRKLLQENFSFH